MDNRSAFFSISSKRKKKSKSKKKKSSSSGDKEKLTRFDVICFVIALVIFIATYLYVEIMNTHHDVKKPSVLESSRYNSKQVKKLAGKVNSLKRKIRILRKQMNDDAEPEDDNLQHSKIPNKHTKKHEAKETNDDASPPRFRQQPVDNNQAKRVGAQKKASDAESRGVSTSEVTGITFYFFQFF